MYLKNHMMLKAQMNLIKHGSNHLSEIELNYKKLGLTTENMRHMATRYPPLLWRILEVNPSSPQALENTQSFLWENTGSARRFFCCHYIYILNWLPCGSKYFLKCILTFRKEWRSWLCLLPEAFSCHLELLLRSISPEGSHFLIKLHPSFNIASANTVIKCAINEGDLHPNTYWTSLCSYAAGPWDHETCHLG